MFQGNNVWDEKNEVAMFQELSSGPASMQAGRAVDLHGLLPGHTIQQADARQAYTQSLLGGVKTYVRLPREAWPQKWIDDNMKDPICPLH